MSLIQEALKRQQMEQDAQPGASSAGHGGAGDPDSGKGNVVPETNGTARKPLQLKREDPKPQPSFDDPPSDTAQTETRRVHTDTETGKATVARRTRVLPALVMVFLTLILLTGIVVWAVMAGLKMAGVPLPAWWPSPASPSPPVLAGAQTPESIAPEPVPIMENRTVEPASAEDPAPPIRNTTGAIVKREIAKADKAVQDREEAITLAAEPVAPLSAETEENPSADTVMEASVPAPAAVIPPPAPPPMVWPELVLTGVAGNEHNGVAFINGKMVGINETIGNVRVVAIRPKAAELEYQGETRLIKVGKALPGNRR